jgi:hypothetical protein
MTPRDFMPARSPASVRASLVGPPVLGLSRMPVVPGLGEAASDQAQAGVTPRVVHVAEQPPVTVAVVHAAGLTSRTLPPPTWPGPTALTERLCSPSHWAADAQLSVLDHDVTLVAIVGIALHAR